jgi:RNA polymerase sigma-70 factor (ECF subfamily)
MGSLSAIVKTGTDNPAPPLGTRPAMVQESARALDDRLIERLRRGDARAFEELYRRHSSRVFSLTLRMVRNRADAEDLLQEIFLQAYDRLSSFEGRSAFGTWLHRLAVNRCLDHLRSRARKEESKNEPLNATTIVGRRPRGTRALELERAIAQLSPTSRAAFLLYDVQGYGHKEVGEMLGVAVGTSKSLVHRARMKLRDLLRPATAGENP